LSIAGVDTAIPVFIGYTQYAGDPVTGAPLYHVPFKIVSMTDYERHFGGAAQQTFEVLVARAASPASGGTLASHEPDFVAAYMSDPGSTAAGDPEATLSYQRFALARVRPQQPFALHGQMRLFFANGGGPCFVVSVGSYWADRRPTAAADSRAWRPGAIMAADLIDGVVAAGKAAGATMTVVPEACQLALDDYGSVIRTMMRQAGTLGDRIAILDLPRCLSADTIDRLEQCQSDLWAATSPAPAGASHAVAYGPALRTSLVTADDVAFVRLAAEEPANNARMNTILTLHAREVLAGKPQLAGIQAAIAVAFPLTSDNAGVNDARHSGDGRPYPGLAVHQTPAQWRAGLDNVLLNALPLYRELKQVIIDRMNVMAPSGAMAGCWVETDRSYGTWRAPTGAALASVTAPLCEVNDVRQSQFAMPQNGQSIDIIRTLPGLGPVAWGVRTLDGNSRETRYIHVRRTLIFIEQSIEAALHHVSLAANDAAAWAAVTHAVSSFLQALWHQGGLIGAEPSEAFTVSCGLGATMTGEDVLNGTMIVAISVCLVRPDDFIALTVTRQMAG